MYAVILIILTPGGIHYLTRMTIFECATKQQIWFRMGCKPIELFLRLDHVSQDEARPILKPTSFALDVSKMA